MTASPVPADQRRLLWTALLVALALNAAYGGLGGVLIPAQVAAVDEAGKELNLAVVMTISSLFTIVVSPLAGAASDRTRTRWGRRTPWMIVAGVLAVPALTLLGAAHSILALTIGWVIGQAVLNVVQAPFEASVAERTEPARRGVAGSVLSAGVAIGLALGVGLTGALVHQPVLVSAVLGLFVAGTIAIYLTWNRHLPEEHTTNGPRRASRMRIPSPRHHPDFARVFSGRFVLVLGNNLVSGYLLYILTDHIGLTPEDAASTAGLVVAVHTLCIAATAAVAGRWSDRTGRRKPFVIGSTVVTAAALLIPLLLPTIPAVLTYAVIAGFGRGIYLAVDTALMIDVLPDKKDTGRDLAVLGLAQVLPMALTPVVAATLLNVTDNDYRILFIVAAALVVLSVIPVVKVRSVP